MRRRGQAADGLELFLDTICNMFGGFLFIMLFVVVSVRTTSDAALRREREELGIVDEVAVEELERELKSLVEAKNDRERDAESIESALARLNDPEVERLYKETVDKSAELKRIVEEGIAARDRAKSERDRIAAFHKTRDELKSRIEAAEADAERARGEKVASDRAKARETFAPQMRVSNKEEVGVILKYGRLYFWHKFEGGEQTDELNVDDFAIVEETGEEIKTEPKPWRGIDLNSESVERDLEEALAKCSPKKHKIVPVVASDSYEEYAVARDFLKGKGFDIRPITGKEGTSVSDRGGNNDKAQ
ncbi:MAG: hypothetical protein IJM30_08045 [Thermoguttaceae bacterium]|nr:hypothetical protein [Thermoguttaceae bacterium]